MYEHTSTYMYIQQNVPVYKGSHYYTCTYLKRELIDWIDLTQIIKNKVKY